MILNYAKLNLNKMMSYHRSKKMGMQFYSVKSIIMQTLRGLKFMHEHWVMHRDIKPENILICGPSSGASAGIVKLADLGLARSFKDPAKALDKVDKAVVTLWYRSPELLLQSAHHTPAIDIWSTGCILCELYLCHTSLAGTNQGFVALFPGQPVEDPTKTSMKPPFETDQFKKILNILGNRYFLEQQWPDLVHFRKFTLTYSSCTLILVQDKDLSCHKSSRCSKKNGQFAMSSATFG